MAKASEVTVSDAEVEAFKQRVGVHIGIFESEIADALAAFLAKRVPDAKPRLLIGELQDTLNEGYNLCRAAVLRGPG